LQALKGEQGPIASMTMEMGEAVAKGRVSRLCCRPLTSNLLAGPQRLINMRGGSYPYSAPFAGTISPGATWMAQ
jgi:hypothetical protein